MNPGLIFARRTLSVAGLLIALALTGMAAGPAAAETLPVPVDRYVDACRMTGAGVGTYSNDGARLVSCKWTSHGKTDCLLENDVVQRCTITCASAQCVAQNPDSGNPLWPLNGGPKSKPAVKATTTGTNAPVN
jgi:hypothetical protein